MLKETRSKTLGVIKFFIFSLVVINVNANEYRFSLLDSQHNMRNEYDNNKQFIENKELFNLENNYTGIALKRIQSHFKQFENNTDWRSRADTKFSSSVWGFISNEIVSAEIKMLRHGIPIYGKDPNTIMTYGDGFLPVSLYSDANWNALLFMNVVNQFLYSSAENTDLAIDSSINLLQTEYGDYHEKITAAASDIRIYIKQLKLYECLAEERRHIINVTLADEGSENYLEFKETDSGELENITVKSIPDSILHIKLPSNKQMADGFKLYNHTEQTDNSYYTIDFNNINTNNVTNMSEMFNKCGNLTSIDLSSFDTINVRNMSKMFSRCDGLISIKISSNFNTSNVMDMSWMFNNCKSLESLDLSAFDTSNVKNMSKMFGYCYSLTSLDLSNFNTSIVSDMARMFNECNSLTSLDLSGFDTRRVSNMTYMFRGCKNLKSLIFENISPINAQSIISLIEKSQSCCKLENIQISYKEENDNNDKMNNLKNQTMKFGYALDGEPVTHDKKVILFYTKQPAPVA